MLESAKESFLGIETVETDTADSPSFIPWRYITALSFWMNKFEDKV